jgi:drug/metabolite transporter (DMT)-like permease
MSINSILPFISTLIMLVFTVSVFQRYWVRRNPAFLYWGIGLLMFGAGSFAEAFLTLAWSPVIFFVWYLFGAALNAAWIGHGTLNLLVKKRWVSIVTIVLIVASLIAAVLMLTTPLDANSFHLGTPISDQYRNILPQGALVRRTTPFFNVYGLAMLVGGALYSAYLFWRKRVLPNRVIGNVLIAAGALSIGFASSLTRLGYGQYLYIGELIAAIMMYGGFLMAAGPSREPAVTPQPTPAES